MGSCDNKKTHRRKPKRTSKSYSAALPIGHQTSVGGICCTSAPVNHTISGTNLLVNGPGLLNDISSVRPASVVAGNSATVGTATSVNSITTAAYLRVKLLIWY
jgi:endonuclease YncB( thermonuclease family)